RPLRDGSWQAVFSFLDYLLDRERVVDGDGRGGLVQIVPPGRRSRRAPIEKTRIVSDSQVGIARSSLMTDIVTDSDARCDARNDRLDSGARPRTSAAPPAEAGVSRQTRRAFDPRRRARMRTTWQMIRGLTCMVIRPPSQARRRKNGATSLTSPMPPSPMEHCGSNPVVVRSAGFFRLLRVAVGNMLARSRASRRDLE